MRKIAKNYRLKMMETNTPIEFFEKALPARFKPEKASGIDVVAQINVTGPEGGNWIVSIKDLKLQVSEGIHPSPTVTLKMNENDFLDMVNGKLSAEKAFFTGRVQFKGNIGVALKLRDAGFL
jgi:putative sterol carrier protein